MTVEEKLKLLELATVFTGLAEQEQNWAEGDQHEADRASAGVKARRLSDRDKHIARASAYLHAARLTHRAINGEVS